MLADRGKTFRCLQGGALGLIGLLGFAASSGFAKGPSLAMLDRLEPGLWDVRGRDEGANFQMCIDSGRRLIQLRHRQETCNRFVVEDTPGQVTVHYTCPANGYGHTVVRFENPRLAQLETQGIEDGLPFNFLAEARRLGGCR